MALDPKKIRSVNDNGDHWVIHHSDHGVFPVAKKGLRPETVKQIQAFADGGKAEEEDTLAPGMASDADSKTLWDTLFHPEQPREERATTAPAPAPPPPMRPELVNSPEQARVAAQGVPGGFAALSDTYNQIKSGAAPAQAMTSPPPAVEAAPSEDEGHAAAAPAQPTQATPAQPASGTNFRDMRDVDAATRQEIEAETNRQNLERDRQTAAAQMQEASLQRQDQIQKDAQAKYQAISAKQEALAEEIANGKIDGNHWWESRNVGQKISATIGMILGGIGAGMVGGQNQAMEIIQSAIGRDMEAQKANLGKKQSLLSSYVQQGHDVQDAMKLAAAHELAAVEGQLRASSARYSALETAPVAQSIAAQLKLKGVQMRQEVATKSLDNAVKREQLSTLQMQKAMMGDQLAAAPLIREIQTKAALGQGLDPKYGPLLDPKTTIKLDDGKLYQASSEDDAKEIKDTQVSAVKVISSAKQILSLLHGNGMAAFGPTAAAGKQAQQELMMNLGDLSKKLKFNKDGREEMEKTISDPSAIFTSDRTITAQMNAVIARAKRAIEAETRARLRNGGGRSGSGGLTVERNE